jgi:hypothetical protein
MHVSESAPRDASHEAFRPGPPPALTSARYAADVNEVEAIGRFDSAIRTTDQTHLALLWEAAGVVDENRIARSVVPDDLPSRLGPPPWANIPWVFCYGGFAPPGVSV